jgi:hypothetical protein
MLMALRLADARAGLTDRGAAAALAARGRGLRQRRLLAAMPALERRGRGRLYGTPSSA